MLRDESLLKFIKLTKTIDISKDDFDFVQSFFFTKIAFILRIKKQLYSILFDFDCMHADIQLIYSLSDRTDLLTFGWQVPNRFSVLLLKKILKLIATNEIKCTKK